MKKRSKTLKPCKWLREHGTSTKPKKAAKVTDKQEYSYVGLSNGQIVHEMTARRMGL